MAQRRAELVHASCTEAATRNVGIPWLSDADIAEPLHPRAYRDGARLFGRGDWALAWRFRADLALLKIAAAHAWQHLPKLSHSGLRPSPSHRRRAPITTCSSVRETSNEQDYLSISPTNGKLMISRGDAPGHLTIFWAHCDISSENRQGCYRRRNDAPSPSAGLSAREYRGCAGVARAVWRRWPRCTAVQSDPADLEPVKPHRSHQVLPSNHR
jgi:hypothetical protein